MIGVGQRGRMGISVPQRLRPPKEVTGMSPFVGVYPDVDKVQRGVQIHASLLGTRLTGGFHAQPVENGGA